MPRKVIAIDLDDTISHFVESWLYHYNNHHYDDLMKEDVSDWDITKFVEPNKELLIMEMLTRPEVYLDAKIRDNARKTIEWMQEIADVYIVTAPGRNHFVYEPKFSWVEKNLPNFNLKNLVFLNAKQLFRADILIDDNPETLERFNSIWDSPSYLFDNPWNRKYNYNRFMNWYQISDFMKEFLQ